MLLDLVNGMLGKVLVDFGDDPLGPDRAQIDHGNRHRTRHLLNQEFMQALLLHFRQHGKKAIEKVVFSQTVLQRGRVFQVAWIRNRFDLQALDKSCPERNGNEPSAYQRGEGQDSYCRRDGDGLLPSAIASSWSQTAGTHHCHCFPRFLAQAKLSQQIADPWVGRSSGTDCGRPSLAMRLWRCASTNALRIATGRLSLVVSAMSRAST